MTAIAGGVKGASGQVVSHVRGKSQDLPETSDQLTQLQLLLDSNSLSPAPTPTGDLERFLVL